MSKAKTKRAMRLTGVMALAATIALSSLSVAIEIASAAEQNYDVNTLYEEGVALSTELEEEGAVLFQNKENALPLAANTQVDLYGYMSYNIIHGGGGSGKGKWDSNCLQEKEAFELAGLDVNDELWKWFGTGAGLVHESWVADRGGSFVNGNTYNIPEVPVDTYKKSKSLAKPETNVAIVTFGRQGHEGAELPMHMDSNYIDTSLSRMGSYGRTYLDPTETELELLDYLKNECGYKKIIVLINSSNVMTIGEYLQYSDACLWIGGPGEAGLIGVAHVMLGKDGNGLEISPSGRTADTWMSDFYSNVVFYNNGDSQYTGVSGGGHGGAQYNQYEEGIFMGYKWYETAYADRLVLKGSPKRTSADDTTATGKTFDYYNDYDSIVTMPFGGGLSYTTFDWEVVSSDVKLIPHGTNTVTVRVTNTGDYAGKDVVQLYLHAPYTAGGIDKAEVSLIGFAKTDRLKPSESGTVTITFETDDVASYDYLGYKAVERGTDYNGNPKWGGFVLEGGEYEIRVQSDSHTQKTDPIKATVEKDAIYVEEGEIAGANCVGPRNGDLTAAYNKLNDVNATDGSGMIWLQRNTIAEDWTLITNQAALTGGGRQDELEAVSMGTPQATAMNTAQKSESKVEYAVPYQNSTKTIKMNYGYQAATEFQANSGTNYWGKSNNDETYVNAVANVGKSTTTYSPATRWTRNGEIKATDVVTTETNPATTYGWDEVPWGDKRWEDWVDQGSWADFASLQGQNYLGSYDSMNLEHGSASDGPGEAGTGGKENNTWWCSEVVMASTWNPELIERVGKAYGKQCVRTGITSCFGPAMNTHRSPFGGRNFEYFSEDGFLAGTMCLAETAGIQSEGVGTFNKHFMLNDLDGGRSGQIVYCNEQALREIYIRAWEYSMKCEEAPMSGMMASLNRIGITWANRGLYTGIIREEYGWHGLTISDGMDGVAYSGEVKAALSGVACLLWNNTVASTSDAENNDGSIFENENVNGTIVNYYGAYQLREVAKMRLWYDTHILAPEKPVFNMNYWVKEKSFNYEMMDVSDLTKNDYTKPQEEEKGGCNGSVQTTMLSVFVLIGAATVVACMKIADKKRGE